VYSSQSVPLVLPALTPDKTTNQPKTDTAKTYNPTHTKYRKPTIARPLHQHAFPNTARNLKLFIYFPHVFFTALVCPIINRKPKKSKKDNAKKDDNKKTEPAKKPEAGKKEEPGKKAEQPKKDEIKKPEPPKKEDMKSPTKK